MCDYHPTDPHQTQTQTQLVTECEINSDESSELDLEQNLDDPVWARLFPLQSGFSPIDLKKDVTLFGRRDDCDVNLALVNTNHCVSSAYSNVHFVIKREFSIKTGSHALLEDKSSNGTFINGQKLGKGRIQALKNNNEIALAKKENKAYIFIDLANKDDKNYPPELLEKYTITKVLGVGAYGEVKLAYSKNTCEKYAIKIISKRKFSVHGKHQLDLNKQVMSEVEILKKLEHPCIIKIKEVIDTKESVFIVLDLVEGGELFDKVVKIGQYNERTAKLLFYQMVLAIKYLHDQGISHRDLKPENILLESSEANETLIKVTDFGLSKFFDSTVMMKTFCGTPNYLAPEVLTTRGEGVYTNKIDNWSLGVILYICLVGYPPFSDEDTKVSLETQIKKGLYTFPDEFWSGISSDAKDVVKKLLTVDPNKRASLEEVLEHKWIKGDREMKAKADALMSEAMKKLNNAQFVLKRELSDEKPNNDSEVKQIMSNPGKNIKAVDDVPSKRRAH